PRLARRGYPPPGGRARGRPAPGVPRGHCVGRRPRRRHAPGKVLQAPAPHCRPAGPQHPAAGRPEPARVPRRAAAPPQPPRAAPHRPGRRPARRALRPRPGLPPARHRPARRHQPRPGPARHCRRRGRLWPAV
ncbi:hypothetical protein H4R21_005413, partial [Coemansia helicoidea]